MNSVIFPALFGVIACVALIVFLWDVVLASVKAQLKPRDLNMAKFFLFLVSLTLVVVAIHYSGSIINTVFVSDGPI